MRVWAVVPARGGSKTIPLKNLVTLGGRPLLDYGIRAAQAWGGCERILCSTEDARIADRARFLGAEVDARPPELSEDMSPVADVVADILARHGRPDLVVLVQPTSPFLLPAHIGALVDAMAADPEARSGQTLAPCPHNHHAWNQREVEGGRARFRFQERLRAYNKQLKPKAWVFGNLVATRPDAVLAGDGLFADPSAAVPIEPPYDFDVDGPADLLVAEALLSSGRLPLAHMEDHS
jgi:CMP-N-acetylneuraminic acid synthetase